MADHLPRRDQLHARIVAVLTEQDYGHLGAQPSRAGMAWAIVNAIEGYAPDMGPEQRAGEPGATDPKPAKCRHEESLYGRCVNCGMTWEQQSPTARIKVTETELRNLWFRTDAVRLTLDHQTGSKVVTMADGTEYETPFAELDGGT